MNTVFEQVVKRAENWNLEPTEKTMYSPTVYYFEFEPGDGTRYVIWATLFYKVDALGNYIPMVMFSVESMSNSYRGVAFKASTVYSGQEDYMVEKIGCEIYEACVYSLLFSEIVEQLPREFMDNPIQFFTR